MQGHPLHRSFRRLAARYPSSHRECDRFKSPGHNQACLTDVQPTGDRLTSNNVNTHSVIDTNSREPSGHIPLVPSSQYLHRYEVGDRYRR